VTTVDEAGGAIVDPTSAQLMCIPVFIICCVIKAPLAMLQMKLTHYFCCKLSPIRHEGRYVYLNKAISY
jgi:hypothetical protein